jgi:membrane-bound lytic murein transglycosylase F
MGSASEPEAPVELDLAEIKKRGKLIALTLNSSTTYFIYRGHAMGFEYELLKRFAKSIGVELEIKLIRDVNTMFELLEQGKGDVIACNLAITSERLQMADFSEPYNFTKLVLVQRLPEGHEHMTRREINRQLVLKPMDLQGKKIYVNRSSTSYSRLMNIKEETGIQFDVVNVPGYIDPEKLIQKVAEGDIDYTVADDNLANLNSTYYNNLDVSVQLSFPRRIGWAVRKNSPDLLSTINEWFETDSRNSVHAYLYKKYFQAPKDQWEEFNGEFSSLNGNKISQYDEFLREYSEIIDWDWRLLAAQMYQESKFREDARSWAGAFGLMQFMPETAKMYGVDSTSGPREHIRGAILHLSRLENFWKERIPDPENRIHFTLASYNAGLGHVIDATYLAADLGYDPMVWENNVAECIKLKSRKEYYTSEMVKFGYCRGEEPVNYVKKILDQYRHYSMVIDRS